MPAASPTPPTAQGQAPGSMSGAPDDVPFSAQNFWSWVAYQFFYRIGWQFKMESTLMAGIVGYLAPDPRIAGLFTGLNTIGKNLAPLVASPLVDRFRYKRNALLVFWSLTTLAWMALTAYLWLPAAANRATSIWVFGTCYTLFFLFLGAVTVAQGALLGKIVPATVRGRAMAVGMTLSGLINVGAILLVYHVVKGGGFPEPRNYALAFTLTVTFFILAGVSLLFVQEKPSDVTVRPANLAANLRYFVKLGRENRNVALLMIINVSVSILNSMLQFYTLYWRQAGTMTESALLVATVVQVVFQSGSSSLLGRMADRKGNRIVIAGLLWVEVLIPLSALVLGGFDPFRSSWIWYIGVYAMVGIRLPVFQLLVNYLLEVVPQRDHAMALGAVTVVQLVTAPAPLLLGAVAGVWGFPVSFVLGSLVGCAAAISALKLQEVRVTPSEAPTAP